MNKTRIVARIVAGAVVSGILLTGVIASPAQARDTGWPTSVSDGSTSDTPKSRRIIG